MRGLETIIAFVIIAIILAAWARRVEAPYPVFLAVGGALLAFVPGTPSFTLPPELALALFLAPVLLDAAYDTSPRDLKDNWIPVTGLVVVAVGLTTAAVAIVVRQLLPEIPWSAAVALGAIVAPPDAAAATAVLRPLRVPHRILTILEGESLLNDATSLLIYKLAVGAAATNVFSLSRIAPTFLVAVVGSLIVGPALGWFFARVFNKIEHTPTAIIVQFVTVFGVWILADRVGLSGVLTMVCFAITIAQSSPESIPARIRIPTNAVWETVVFILNILAFIFIGLQVRPILNTLDASHRDRYLKIAVVVLAVIILVRIIWHMSFNAFVRWRDRTVGFNPPRPMLRATIGSGLVISWSGMRGIVSLAAALALPEDFPHRDLIVLTAFCIVLGTLVIQGLTLKSLLRILDFQDADPVTREVAAARRRAMEAALATLGDDRSQLADALREEFEVSLAPEGDKDCDRRRALHSAKHRAALEAARREVFTMRNTDEIGDDAFHIMEETLDWHEMALGSEGE